MLILAMGSLLVFLVMVHLIIGRTCRESRSVLLQLPLDKAWESIRDFGALHAAHGRGRPLVEIESSEIIRGDGLTPGSIWRQRGTWDGGRFWSEIELIGIEAPHRLVVSLRRDSFGTQSGLMRHRCALELIPGGPGGTRLRLRMTARLNNLRLVLLRTLSPERMHARLLDLGLRSAKLALEGARTAEAARQLAPQAVPEFALAAPPRTVPFPAPITSSLGAPLPETLAAPTAAIAVPTILPEWIKPEVAAAALYSFRPGSSRAWATSPEGALDRS